MELFFTDESFMIGNKSIPGVPFFVDGEFGLMEHLNDFFLEELIPDGRCSSPKTWKGYAYSLLDFMQWAEAAEIDWSTANRTEVSVYRDWSLEDCGLQRVTVNTRLSAIKRFYAWAERKGLVAENPIKEIRVKSYSINPDGDYLAHTRNNNEAKRNDLSLKTFDELPKSFARGEIERILRKTKNLRLKLMMLVMWECGLRREEVVLLPEELILDCERQAQKNGPSEIVEMQLPGQICKGHKPRMAPISYALVMKLRQYRTTVRPKLAKRHRERHRAVATRFWLNKYGDPLSVAALSSAVSEAGNAAGINGATPHRFRHTFATEMYALTGDLRLVQKLLGHSNIQTTTTYEHAAATDRRGFLEQYQQEIDDVIARVT